MSRDILQRPLVTEKMTDLMAQGHYAFIVDLKANKIEIRKALEAHYPQIKIKEVRTVIVRGKRRRQMTKRGVSEGRTARYKKAIITLTPDSEQIDFYENV